MSAGNNSKKLLLVAHISDKCNFQCSYCYSHRSKEDMPVKVIKALASFAKSLVDNRFYEDIVLAVEGGEPTLDMLRLKKLIKDAKEKKVDEFIVCTNGKKIDKKMADFFAANKVYPVISFESKKPFIMNRALPDSEAAAKIWHKIDDSLIFFVPYLDSYGHDEMNVFDSIRGRITITPSAIGYLADSVNHLYRSAIGEKVLITLMPAMSEDLEREWRALAADKKAVFDLEKQFLEIAKLYLLGLESGRHLNFCINECISTKFSNLSSSTGLEEVPFCNAGRSLLGVGMKGDIFPCYLLSAAKQSLFRDAFKIGDVFDGFCKGKEKVVDKFCGKKQNKHFSCLYWNWIANGRPDKPAIAYSLIFNAWKKAAFHIQKELSKN